MIFETVRLTIVNNTRAAFRDELLTCNGTHSLDDAVQVDMEDMQDIIAHGEVTDDTSAMLVEIESLFCDSAVFHFV